MPRRSSRSAQYVGSMLILVLACSHHALAQSEFTSTTTVTGPKTETEVGFTSTQEPVPGGAAAAIFDAAAGGAAAGGASPAITALLNSTKEAVDSVLAGMQQRLGEALSRAGVTSESYAKLLEPVRAGTSNLLAGLDAVRTAYEKTLQGYFGLLLDNTKELRKTLEDGNAVIDTINTLRGAECKEASFTPPTAKSARITGAGGSLAFTTGECTLTRAAKPLQLDYVLACTEPGISYAATAPRYTSRFVAAAEATTEECTVVRKYGVESETTITLFDPASFFAPADDEADAEAASGPADNSTVRASSGARNMAAGWYKTLFPVAGQAGERVTFLPGHVRAALEKAISDVSVDFSLNYKPFNLKHNLQEHAEATARLLSKYFDTKQKLLKVYKKEANSWLDAEYRAEITKDLDFGGNLAESLKNVNMTDMFDGLFAKTASQLMSNSKLGAVNGGRMAASAAGLLGQLSTDKPLRSLLSKARSGLGEPVSVKLTGSLDAATEAAQAALGGFDLLGVLGQGGGLKTGSLAEMLLKDPGMGGKLKQLADTLQAATAGLKQGGGGAKLLG